MIAETREREKERKEHFVGTSVDEELASSSAFPLAIVKQNVPIVVSAALLA